MTLINYRTRVHFADDVLEEALWGEMTDRRARRPFIICDTAHASPAWVERLLTALPLRSHANIYENCPSIPDEKHARAAALEYRAVNADVLIAFGGADAMDFAKAVRLAIANKRPLSETASPASARLPRETPDLIVVPTISGFGAAVSPYATIVSDDGARVMLSGRHLIPTVAICDPTLTLGADACESASAGASAFATCFEAYLAQGYNPPADGIALDGLRRAFLNAAPALGGDALDARREVTAAGLNGALAQEKGPGATFALSHALSAISKAAPDTGAIARLVLPGILRINGGGRRDPRRLTIRDMLDLSPKDCLADGVERFMAPLPLPFTLSEMGVNEDELASAAEAASVHLAIAGRGRGFESADLYAVLKAVH